MALDQTWAKKVQDHCHGGAALPQPTGLKILLMTANGTPAANGTEVATSGGYTAGTGQPAVFGNATTASPSVSASSGVTSFTNMPGVTTVGIELWNSTSRQEFGALSASKTTAAGDTLSFAAGAITSSLS